MRPELSLDLTGITKGAIVVDLEALKAEVKKLSTKAMQLKLDLHDLSEELPQNWQSILDIAKRTHDAFALLEKKRAELNAAEQ
jgi:hypothetical protein